MLEKIPAVVGHVLQGVRSGPEKLIWADRAAAGPPTLRLSSPDFEDEGPLPVRCTADGAGASPPLDIEAVPGEARALILAVEDADSPSSAPLVHLLALFDPDRRSLPEGVLSPPSAQGVRLGRSSLGKLGWLPPDPPPGHGPHRYVFQLFAVARAPSFSRPPSKRDAVAALREAVVARGRLTGIYQRPG